MAYSIPPVYRPGFQLLSSLPDEAYERLRSGTREARATANLDEFARTIGERSGIAAEVAAAILTSVFSLAALRSRDRASSDEIADSLIGEELNLDPDEEVVFKRRVAELIDEQSVRVAVRAIDLFAAGERLLLSSRIITDVRPVFPDLDMTPPEGPIAPLGVLVVHSLRLEYIEAGVAKTFVVSLDGIDITLLREALDRAIRKAESGESLAATAGIPSLSPRQEGT